MDHGIDKHCDEDYGTQGIGSELGMEGKRHINSQDPLHGIGDPMTRRRIQKMKEALHGLIYKIQEEAQQTCMGGASGPLITLIKAQK